MITPRKELMRSSLLCTIWPSKFLTSFDGRGALNENGRKLASYFSLHNQVTNSTNVLSLCVSLISQMMPSYKQLISPILIKSNPFSS